MNKPANGHSRLRANLAKHLRMNEDSDDFGYLWDCLKEDRHISEWELGISGEEEILREAQRLLTRLRAWPGRTFSARPKQERRDLQDIPVEPTAREREMTRAFREYLASHAAQRPIVQRFRREYLPDGLKTDDHDISLLLEEQKVSKAGTDVQQYLDSHRGKPDEVVIPIDFSPKPPPDDDFGIFSLEDLAIERAEEEINQERKMMEEWWGESQPEFDEDDWEDDLTEEEIAQENQRKKSFEGYFGWYLEEIGEWLAVKYPWENVGDAVVFLISGRPPRLAQTVSANMREGTATFSISFLPWVSEETILHAYHSSRPGLVRSRLPGNKTIRVLRFVAEQTDEEGHLPSWSTLLDRWNAANPEDKFSDRSALRRAYRRAVEGLVPPSLPLAENAATWYQRFRISY